MHLVIEALRLSFADTFKYCADPEHTDIPVQKLLSKGYAGERLQLISKERYACWNLGKWLSSVAVQSKTLYGYCYVWLNCLLKLVAINTRSLGFGDTCQQRNIYFHAIM